MRRGTRHEAAMRENFRFLILDFGLKSVAPVRAEFKIQNPKSKIQNRSAFTLTELLITITIITILSGLGLSAYTGAIDLARDQRTRAMIDKIDTLIMERYEGYRTRA